MWMCMIGHDHGETQQSHATSRTPVAEMTCTHCGYPLQAAFAFCPNCGTSLRTASCWSCGRDVEATWKTCPYCRSELGVLEEFS
jgi:RNA polymerase subunit RPABC4/transcription elongation factor Spt4